jgi:Uma2 family endonuclease
MAIEQQARLTADEFLCFQGEEDKLYELIDGDVIEVSPSPGPEHGGIVYIIGVIIGEFVRTHKLGRVYAAETGFQIRQSPDRVRAPDGAFVARGRLPAGPNPKRYFPFAPDFVVEVVSPSDSAQRIQDKVDDWLQAGTLVVWVVYPSGRSVMLWRGLDRVERRSQDDDLDAEPALPGFSCKVRDLFVED